MKQRHGDTQFLDGLRGVAALSVVLSHLALWYYPAAHSGQQAHVVEPAALWLFNSPVSFFYKGGYAVSIFFVLSGFVLSSIGLKKCDDRTYLAKATAKRYIRLGGPVAASVLMCVLLKSAGVFHNGALSIAVPLSNAYDLPADWWAALKSAAYGAMIYGDRSYNYVLWTISIEFFGSLFIFALVSLFGFSRPMFRLSALVATLMFFIQPGHLTYYAMFFAGAYLSTFDYSQKKRAGPAIAALLVGLYFGGYAANSVSYQPLANAAYALQGIGIKLNWPIAYSCIGAVGLLYGVLGLHPIRKALNTRPLIWLGSLSFSLYLIHSFVLTALAGPIMHAMGTGIASFAVATVSVMAISLLASHVFWRLVDIPSMRLADHFGESVISVLSAQPSKHGALAKL